MFNGLRKRIHTAIVLNLNGTMNAWYRASESVDCACQEISFFGHLVEIRILLPPYLANKRVSIHSIYILCFNLNSLNPVQVVSTSLQIGCEEAH